MTKNKIRKLNLGFNIGHTVEINEDHMYISYTQFVKRHPKYASRFQYKCWLDKNGAPFTVKGVYRHVRKDEHDKCKYVVVVADKFKRIYLVGELGIKRIFILDGMTSPLPGDFDGDPLVN